MADPTRFVPSYDFSEFQAVQPTTPLPGVQVDVALADISTSTTELRDAIIDIRRSDGALKNGIVTEDSLAVDLVDLLTTETAADVAAAAASAAAAAASADESETNAVALEAATTALEAAIDAFETGGFFGDYGSITETAGPPTDYGSIA